VFNFCRAVVQATTDPFIVQKLGRFAAPGAETIREVNDVVSTAITQLGFIDNAAIADSLSGYDAKYGRGRYGCRRRWPQAGGNRV
jgi:hypothetical protein